MRVSDSRIHVAVGDLMLRPDGWWRVTALIPTYALEIGGDDFDGGVACEREFRPPPVGTKYIERLGETQVKTWR